MCDMRCSKISAASVRQPSFQPHTWAKTNNWVYDFHSSSRELNILQILQLCSSTPLYSSYGKQAVSWLPCSHHGLKRPGTVRGVSSLGSQLVLLGWASKWNWISFMWASNRRILLPCLTAQAAQAAHVRSQSERCEAAAAFVFGPGTPCAVSRFRCHVGGKSRMG